MISSCCESVSTPRIGPTKAGGVAAVYQYQARDVINVGGCKLQSLGDVTAQAPDPCGDIITVASNGSGTCKDRGF